MEIALVFVVVTLLLAIFDLTVGVANDAVNFLNSAVGSKATTFRRALIVASLGVLVGVTLSSGMMEIARKGIFNPSAFTLYDVLIIFFATAATDIILLDFFNTFGIPTSTTVSLVSSLTGAALALGIIHISSGIAEGKTLIDFLNLTKLTTIYTAIIISIVVSFIIGFSSQLISRLIFSFNYIKVFRWIGPLWAAFSITFILFFILVKGLEGASFATKEMVAFVNQNLYYILLANFIFWSVIFYLMIWVFKTNILRFVVLVGTFALAMSFASNDLVNFVGPALASLASYQYAIGHPDPLNMTMESLAKPVSAPTWILLASGFVMVMTLFLSRKARTVTSTEVNLGRQFEGYEAFESIPLARAIIRIAINVSSFLAKIVPESVRNWVNSRFEVTNAILLEDKEGNKASFDLIRAVTNLSIAAGLISLGTSLKLPLSTTYVTFIVAMSTAFADRAWSSDVAVYRISGILTVIGGWFLTAVICIITSGLMATIIYFTNIIGVFIFVGLIAFIIVRTTLIHRKREKIRKQEEEKLKLQAKSLESSFVVFKNDFYEYLTKIKEITNLASQGLIKYKLKDLKKAYKQAEELQKKTEVIFTDFARLIKSFQDDEIGLSYSYSSSLSELSLLSSQVFEICERSLIYVDNSQKQLTTNQVSDLKNVLKHLNQIFDKVLKHFELILINNVPNPAGEFEMKLEESEFDNEIKRIHKTYLKAMRRPTSNPKRAILFMFFVESLFSISKRVSVMFSNFFNLAKEVSSKQIVK